MDRYTNNPPPKEENNMRNFNELPADVQNKIKEIAKAYSEVRVVYEYGKYNVGGGICLKAKYAPDYEVIGDYYAKDLFTPEERILNYVEAFHEYPIQYKGERNYKMLKEIRGNWDLKFRFDDNGNIVIA